LLVPSPPTERAPITVDAAGENTIVVRPGANHDLTPDMVTSALTLLAPVRAAVVLGVCEVPAAVVDAAAAASVNRHRLVLNQAPFIPVHLSTLKAANPLIVNRVEAEQLVSHLGVGRDALAANDDYLALAAALKPFAKSVVITLGADGAVVADGDVVKIVPPVEPLEVVDTTGTGDAFVGAVIAELVGGASLLEAVEIGCAAGSAAVSRYGTTKAFPTPAEIRSIAMGNLRG
jgi:ribokinase